MVSSAVIVVRPTPTAGIIMYTVSVMSMGVAVAVGVVLCGAGNILYNNQQAQCFIFQINCRSDPKWTTSHQVPC